MYKFLKITIIFSVFLFLLFGFFHTISAITQDLGRHLLTGRLILEGNQVPRINLFSYAYPDFPFINHHWLSEVIFYIIFKLFGFNGLLILTVLLILSSFLIIFLYIFKKSNIIGLSIASLLYIFILFERTDIRPEILSFFFLSIFITILYLYREKFTKWIFILIPIEILWVNIHIYFVIGILVIGLFFTDLLISNRTKLNSRYISIFAVVLIASLLATLINPNGIKGALYPLNVFKNYGYSIEENQNIFFLWSLFHGQTTVFFAISFVLLFLSLILTFKKTYPIDWFLSILFSIAAASAIRSFPLFVFATFIPLTKSLSPVVGKIFKHLRKLPFFSKTKLEFIKIAMLSIVLIFIVFQIKQTTKTRQAGFGLEKGANNAVDFFSKNNLKGPIFNNFDVGSYLEYRLYPKEKVFVDGRPEAYPASFFQKIYIPMQQDPALFKKNSEKYKFNIIFFSHTDQTPWAAVFLQQIVNNKDWKIVYLDDYAIILVKADILNEKLIKKFAMNESNIQISNLNLKNINSIIRLSIFFNRVGWTKQEIAMYENILAIKPNNCPALYNLTARLIQQQSPLSNIYITRYNSNCK